eukprot:6206585-Pleurochrysis_carterae.AAC.1
MHAQELPWRVLPPRAPRNNPLRTSQGWRSARPPPAIYRRRRQTDAMRHRRKICRGIRGPLPSSADPAAAPCSATCKPCEVKLATTTWKPPRQRPLPCELPQIEVDVQQVDDPATEAR